MGLRVELEMLVFLLLLNPLISGGLLMPKCKLVEELNLIVPQDVVDRENLLAELTCRAEIAAQFETSRKNQVSSQDFSKVRKTRDAFQTTDSPITTNPVAKSRSIPDLDSSTNPPRKSNTNPPPENTINPRLDSATKQPPKSNTNPPPKSTMNPSLDLSTKQMPKSNTNPPPKNTINPRLDSSTKPPPKSNTPTKQSKNLLSKLGNNPQEPVIKVAKEEMYPPFNSTPMQGATPSPPNFNSTYMSPRRRRGLNGLLTLYGVFQLADRVACTTSAKKPSFNVCKLQCDKLTDDDITDDINCALTILKTGSNKMAKPEIQKEANRLIRNLSRMLKNTCPNMDAAKYLAECQNP